ncbi:MAG: hypothetical protein ISQ85_03405 [Planktomarina sp.]|nr:hypothetical protein [Planktomarina sp.]
MTTYLKLLMVAPIIERIDSGCASNPMRVLIRMAAPCGMFLKLSILSEGDVATFAFLSK